MELCCGAAGWLSLSIVLAAPVSATIVADTGAPNSSRVLQSFGMDEAIFGLFNATVNRITGIQGYLSSEFAFPKPMTISLYADDHGAPDFADIIGSTDIMVPGGSSYFDFKFVGATDLSLPVIVGRNYWVSFGVTSGGGSFLTPSGVSRPLAGYGSANLKTGRFLRIDGMNAPFVITGENILSPVPEPATWTMMIAGFATVGCVLRRRQMVVRFV